MQLVISDRTFVIPIYLGNSITFPVASDSLAAMAIRKL
jgi:hypothetical protein